MRNRLCGTARGPVALTRSILGRGVAYAEEVHGIFIGDGTYSVPGPAVQNPNLFRSDFRTEQVQRLQDVSAYIDALDVAERPAIDHSLRWANRACEIASGPDAILAWWISLECLVGERDADVVKAVHHGLAAAYSVTPERAGNTFQMGRVYGLRGDIVHRGEAAPIHGAFLEYMEAVHSDIAQGMAGLRSRRALDLIERGAFVPNQLGARRN